MSYDVRAFALGMPKAELHLHLEGTLEPELMFELAGRNHVPLRYKSAEAAREAYNFTDLASFLRLYYVGCDALVTEDDFYDLTWAYLLRAAKENIIHVEPMFDPQTHTDRGIHFGTVATGIMRALDDAQDLLGISSRLIMAIRRDLPVESAMQSLEHARLYGHHIAAIGLDSAEVGHPPEEFAGVFEEARMHGFRVVAHAGEEGPPAYITGALDALGAERIDHGVRCLEDPELTRRLARDRVPLTVCPLSNVRLKVVDSMQDHPLGRMMEAGLAVTINSDDPAYFGGYLTDNFVEAARALDLSRADLVRLAAASFEASFLEDGARDTCLAVLRAYAAAHAE